MRNHQAMLLIIYLLGILATTISYAEELSNIIDVQQVKAMLGEPDKITQTSSDSETWEYGSSKIFIRDGKTIAWSDNGELGELAATKKLRIEKTVAESKDTQNWINPWTPPPPENKEQTIKEIVP